MEKTVLLSLKYDKKKKKVLGLHQEGEEGSGTWNAILN